MPRAVASSRVPTLPVPRLPLVPDLLRRIHVPRDLEPITHDLAGRGGPGRRGDDGGGRRADLGRGGGAVPQRRLPRGRRSACAARARSCSTARSAGRAATARRGAGTPTALAKPDTPFVIFSAAKAMTATVAHLLDERGLLPHRRPRVRVHPRVRPPRQGRDHDRARALAPRRRRRTCPATCWTSTTSATASCCWRALCDAKPRTRPGKLLSYHAVSGGFIIAEIVQRVTGKDIRQVMAEEILDPLGFRWGNYGVAAGGRRPRSAAPTPPARRSLPPLSTVLTRALGPPPDEVTRISNDPRFLTGDHPGGQRRHHRERALALLRAAARGRRARRRARDGGAHDPPRDGRARLPRDRPDARRADAPRQRVHARRAGGQPVRARHRAGLRPPRLHQRPRLGRPGARALRRADHVGQADPAPRAAATCGPSRAGSAPRRRRSSAPSASDNAAASEA